MIARTRSGVFIVWSFSPQQDDKPGYRQGSRLPFVSTVDLYRRLVAGDGVAGELIWSILEQRL
jgi:hypothetical protein